MAAQRPQHHCTSGRGRGGPAGCSAGWPTSTTADASWPGGRPSSSATAGLVNPGSGAPTQQLPSPRPCVAINQVCAARQQSNAASGWPLQAQKITAAGAFQNTSKSGRSVQSQCCPGGWWVRAYSFARTP